MNIEKEIVFNVVHHGLNRSTDYLMVVPDESPDAITDIQIAHLRESHGNRAFEASGGREFTVAWTLLPLVDNPERFIFKDGGIDEPIIDPSVSDYSKRAVCLVFAVSVYNSKDASTGQFFCKKAGRERASSRLRYYLTSLRNGDNDEQRVAFADHSVLEVASSDCVITGNGYLELPRLGRFLYDSVRQTVLDNAAVMIGQELDRDTFWVSGVDAMEEDLSSTDLSGGRTLMAEKGPRPPVGLVTFEDFQKTFGSPHDSQSTVVTDAGKAAFDLMMAATTVKEEPSAPTLNYAVQELAPGVSVFEVVPESEPRTPPDFADESKWPTAEEAKANSGGCGNCANCECDGAGSNA
jgi:hypothetical protein